MQLRPVMFVGTGSDVGKSVINAAFCRIFKQDGFHPAPFKAQNMSLNSYATPDGLEIGRAQATQAEACGIPCRADMNPVLLKPTDDTSSQVVLNGKVIGNQSAHQYFNQTDRNDLFLQAMAACHRLTKEFNPLVIEGAGSISEINLWDRDITNMRVAEALNAPTFLIADIDRGGVFASVYGSIQLLPETQKKLIKGVLINKFRGDMALFEDGKKMLEELTGVPVVGVIPYFHDIHIDQEDSVTLEYRKEKDRVGKVTIAVVLLRHLSNFTDFNMLEQHPDVHLFYASHPEELADADIILLPGSKNTIDDLNYLRQSGMAKAILQQHAIGKSVYGICGGYQMMGNWVEDPLGIEGDVAVMQGLGLLPVRTILTREKKTEACHFSFLGTKPDCTGYEIHMGETVAEQPSPLCLLDSGVSDGYFRNEKTFGTYLHGFFDHTETVGYILRQVPGYKSGKSVTFDYPAFKEEQYDKLAAHIRQHVDMEYIYKTMQPDD
ncbi:adenosylcobyric acid synthase [Microbacter margulisiae]|uniref:Cobyric acid synthase n=2 Tax=Microbacter margulisiae TaxID=1350067 RepID=A0A7W5DNQ8_9PORP|nr:adenosylcobyric acid synthase [Microbacter margulisiae]